VVLPKGCLYGSDGRTCSLQIRHYRRRKTGPAVRLAVVRCSVHPTASFTLYPPGFTPYGRTLVAPVALSGEVLRDGDSGEVAWHQTIFIAALTAASSRRWPSVGAPSYCRRTQGRWLVVALHLLGLVLTADAAVYASMLGIPTMRLIDSRKRAASRSWTHRGCAVEDLLTELPCDDSLLARLLKAGDHADLWTRRSQARERPPDRGGGRLAG